MDLHKQLETEINKRKSTRTKTITLNKVYLVYCCTYISYNHIGIFTSYKEANKIKSKLKTELNITVNIEEFILDKYSFKGL